MIRLELLEEELRAAGLNLYRVGLDRDGTPVVRFLDEQGLKRPPTMAELEIFAGILAAHRADGLTAAESTERNRRSALVQAVRDATTLAQLRAALAAVVAEVLGVT